MNRPFAAALFLADYGIPQGTSSREFIQVACPYCGGSSTSPYSLGFHVSKGYCSCWRCGWWPLVDQRMKSGEEKPGAIRTVLGCSLTEAREILAAYSFTAHAPSPVCNGSKVRYCNPPGTQLTAAYSRYLDARGFDPDWIALEHGVLAAGPRCFWDAGIPLDDNWKGQWFSNRLIIPIKDASGRVVNFQGRSILPDALIRYKGARVDKVPTHHKHLLYGAHRDPGDMVAVVEGVMDQWKLGRGSVATFGTSLTIHQIRLLGRYRRVLLCFDSEPTAQAKARRWALEVAALGASVDVVDLELGDRDIGDLSDSEVAAVRRELGLD